MIRFLKPNIFHLTTIINEYSIIKGIKDRSIDLEAIRLKSIIINGINT
ncbi:hypothetical protein [Thiospirochaeta perfilievii]|nr:hypothetical protein [Thiospirochaeta perfilievii]